MDNYVGAIILFAGNFVIRGYAACNGQLLNISQNAALFSILGTTYGGDGRSTFGLPDLRGRVPLGYGSGGPGVSSYALGQMAGVETVTLSQNQMPTHNHLVNAQNGLGNLGSPTGGYLATTATRGGVAPPFDTYIASTPTPTQLNQNALTMAGGNQSHPNIQPYLALNFLICTQGIFPSRS